MMRLVQWKSGWLGLIALIVTGLLIRPAGSAFADVPNVLQDADPAYLESWESEIDKQLELLTAAYGLDEDSKKSLRTELELRLVLERDYETKMNAEIEELSNKAIKAGVLQDENSPEMKAIADRFVELAKNQPLNENLVADWVGGRVSPEVAQEGKQRWQELVQRRSQVVMAKTDDDSRVSGRKADIAAEAREDLPRYSTEGRAPLPHGDNGDFVDEDTMRKAGRPYVKPSDIAAAREKSGMAPVAGAPSRPGPAGRPSPVPPMKARPGAQAVTDSPDKMSGPGGPPRPPEPLRLNKPAASPGQPAAPAPPAPPLDDWEKYVVGFCQKYGFDSGQNMRAQAILSDLRKRAYQYQLSRSEEYARTELMTDAKARSDSMNHLNAPLDALFAELKQRLENLPTMAQKQREGQPAKGTATTPKSTKKSR